MAPQTSRFDPKRILIVLHGSIGDVTRALPLAAMLRGAFPHAFLAWSIEPACFPLLQGNNAVDEIIVLERRRWWRNAGSFLTRVRAGNFDLVLDLQRLFKSGFISWWSGAGQRIGFHRQDSKEFNWLFNNLHIPAYGEKIPKIEHYLKFADFLGIERSPLEWQFNLTAGEQAAIGRHLSHIGGSFAVLFVGTRWESKQWFPSQISQCADQLQADYELESVLLGSRDDQPVAQEVEALSRSKVTNLVGRTTLREAIGVIQRSRVAVGPDTGLMHIAAALRTPVISLWGATSPQRTGPYGYAELVLQGKAPCVPCHRRTCSIGRVCLQSITTEQIGAKIRKVLGDEKRAPVTHAG
ncbi:MAG: glycosyltransferase family 9 protein [Candidatus Binatia bacterium]